MCGTFEGLGDTRHHRRVHPIIIALNYCRYGLTPTGGTDPMKSRYSEGNRGHHITHPTRAEHLICSDILQLRISPYLSKKPI